MLSERLDLAIRLANGTDRFADIGADHGFLSAELLKRNPEATGIVTDLSGKALAKAKRLIGSMGMGNRVRFEVADGLEPLKDCPVKTVFILGMGGDTIAGILLRGNGYLHGEELILGGHTELPALRKTVYQVGYHIREEAIAREKDRFYFLLHCLPGRKECLSQRELYLGACLTETLPAVWLPYLKKQEKYLSEGIAAMENAAQFRQEERRNEFRQELIWVREILERYENESGEES